jgi:hypothetical protein
MLAKLVRLTCWSQGWREWRVDNAWIDPLELAAQAASETTRNSEPVFRRSFHDGRFQTRSPFRYGKVAMRPNRVAGKRNGAAVAETSGAIGLPIPCSPGASDRPSRVVLVR